MTTTGWSFPYCPAEPDWRLDWQAIEDEFDWIRTLRGCPQDPLHHAEGDVLTHTRLVAESLTALPAWRALAPAARSTLFAAALLHDVAKPAYTQVGADGRVSSRGHVKAGARLARKILWLMGVPFHYREMVVALVRHSGLPFHLFDKPSPQRAAIEASITARCDWLALLAEADARGRESADRNEQLERIELFREYCREQRCYEGPRAFASAHSRFIYFRKEDSDPDYVAYDDTRCQVTLMSGLPGAGKDHWMGAHCPELPVVSLDALRVEMKIPARKNQGAVAVRAKERAREHLRVARAFVWSATNTTKQMRAQLIDLFYAYKAGTRIVYVESAYQEIIRRNRARDNPVPAAVINRLADRLDIPDLTEAHELVWAVD